MTSHTSPDTPVDALLHAAALLSQATTVCVLSGAGLSKASGIPTYRDVGGLWNNPETARFSHIDDFREDPVAFSKFWSARRSEIRKARPNPGHDALVELLRRRPGSCLVTQNVDGLLQRAGAPDVLELHIRRGCDATNVDGAEASG